MTSFHACTPRSAPASAPRATFIAPSRSCGIGGGTVLPERVGTACAAGLSSTTAAVGTAGTGAPSITGGDATTGGAASTTSGAGSSTGGGGVTAGLEPAAIAVWSPRPTEVTNS